MTPCPTVSEERTLIESFVVGLKRASASQKMILWLLGFNILSALPLIVPVFLLLQNTTSNRLAAERMFADKLDVTWLIDLINEQMKSGSLIEMAIHTGLQLYVVGVLYLLLNLFFAGGILEVLTSEDRRFTLRKFWAWCGAYCWRFFRLFSILIRPFQRPTGRTLQNWIPLLRMASAKALTRPW